MAFTPTLVRALQVAAPPQRTRNDRQPVPRMSRMLRNCHGHHTGFWIANAPEAIAAAKIEVSETDKEISIVAELPGVSEAKGCRSLTGR